ncbi:MAG: DUF885 domain-containing protein [Lachnospiraceae bacterium]|nr:DUF885 domain-containing protein [uncultured Acetatifactor sp.]MCI8287698.1 DUF885 domain-containing protein [Lachnospiraceae bacterium]
MTLFLFSWRRDEKRFTNITNTLFINDMKANTLNMHYTLANPDDFGIHEYEPVLSCYHADLALQSQAETENTLAALKTICPDRLSESDAILWRLMTRSLENTLALDSFPYYSEPLSPSSGAQSRLPILLAEYTFRSKRDVEDYLMLLDQTNDYFSSLLIFEQEKAAAGYGMPGAFLKEVRKQCDTVITAESLDTGTHFLQTTFQERLEKILQEKLITPEEAAAYTAQNNRLLKTVLLPAYIALGDGLLQLEDDSILPSGLAALPDGQTYYEQLLISETGSYRPINELQEMLTTQFGIEYGEIKKLARNHPEIVQKLTLDTTENFPYKNASQMILDLQNRMAEDFPAIPGPSSNIAVKAVSPSLEAYCAPAFYLTAPLDDTAANNIYINRSKTPDGLELYTTLAHEGYPGHLYQTVYHNRTALSSGERPARQLLWYGGYQEGWALYVEFLSYDYAVQLLLENNQEMAALMAQLEKHNRSLQLCLYSLLDIMIHYENAGYSQIAKVLESFGITDSESSRAIYNYIIQAPCNYPKYYLGYLEILSLREQAKELWEKEYTDYRFHCFYLDCGPSDFLSLQERLQS